MKYADATFFCSIEGKIIFCKKDFCMTEENSYFKRKILKGDFIKIAAIGYYVENENAELAIPIGILYGNLEKRDVAHVKILFSKNSSILTGVICLENTLKNSSN